MDLLLFYVFFQVFEYISSSVTSKICYGGKVEYLPMGCEKVIGYPLVIENFNYELTIDTDVGKILSSIKRVHNGIIIRNNGFDRFNIMKSLQYLANHPDSGPLLQIEQNPFLISFDFASLRMINGSMPVVGFWNDHFPVQMRRSTIAFQNLLDFLATASHTIDPCSADYFDLYVNDKKSPPGEWYFLLAGSFGVLSLVIIIDIIWFSTFQQWWEQKLDFLKLQREKEAIGKQAKQFETAEKYRLECLKIEDEEKKFLENLKKETKDDPYHAPGELEKWANQKKREQEREKKRQEVFEKMNEEEIQVIEEQKKKEDKPKTVIEEKPQDKKETKEKEVKKSTASVKKEKIKEKSQKPKSIKKKEKMKSVKGNKKSVKKVRFEELGNEKPVVKETKPDEEVLDPTQADDDTPSIKTTMKTQIPSDLIEASTMKSLPKQ